MSPDFLRLDSLVDDVFDSNPQTPTNFASGDDLIRNALSLTGLEAIAEENNGANEKDNFIFGTGENVGNFKEIGICTQNSIFF